MTRSPLVVYLAMLGWITATLHVQGKLELSHLSSVYLPSAPQQRVEFDAGAVEQIAYDPDRKLIYAVGDSVLHVISASDPNNLVVELTRYEENKDFTDVVACDDHVFVTVHDKNEPLNGVLRVYSSFAKGAADPLVAVDNIPVGSQPDMVIARKDCKTFLVAVEGELFSQGGNVQDPEGKIAVIQFPDGIGKDKARVKVLDFNAFDNRYDELKPSGVRFVYTGNGNKLSNDLEPEYIAIDEDSNKAYVVFQENNAVAEVDLATQNVTSIRGLGYKQWGYLDASDRDDGIEITYWPIRAWYTPDAIRFHQWQGRKLLFTANEGGDKEYDTPAFNEAVRGYDINPADLGDDVHTIVRSGLDDEKKLGRLRFSQYDGKDASGKYTALYTYGGRSFSIWDVSNAGQGESAAAWPQIFDSGSQLEELTAVHCPHLFNRKENEIDDRSDDKGPEPESLALAELDGRLYIFIGVERPGSIFVYSLGRYLNQPRFETIFCDGIPDESKTMEQLFNERKIYAADPEDLRFFPAAQSPTGRPVLIVSGSVSGTVTLLDVKVTQDPDTDSDRNIDGCGDGATILGASMLITLLSIMSHLW